MGTAIFLSVGFAFSRQVRCITVLTIPEFTTRAGRRTVQATILILLISGPMRNIADNGEETVRFLKCIKDMLLDILIAGKDLVFAPIQHILFDLRASTSGVQESAESKYNMSVLQELMAPIVVEVEGDQERFQIKDENNDMDEAMGLPPRSEEVEVHYKFLSSDTADDKIEKSYRKKLAYRCEEVFSKGTMKCVELFNGKYEDCNEAVTKVLGWALCWPMKLTFICDILTMFAQDKVCEMSDVIEAGFGETYSVAIKGIEDFSKSFNVRVNYQGLSEMINLSGLKSARDELLEHFLGGRKYVEWYLSLVKRALALSYLVVVYGYGALEYHVQYCRSLSADNVYVTAYFREIDERRRGQSGKETLLPLKSFERPNFSRLNRIKLTEKEWKKFGDQLFALLIQAGVVFSVFGFDFLYTELLQLVQNHADMHIRQIGHHVLEIQVVGEGLLAQLLRVVIKDFSINEKIDISHFSKPCLPVPRVTPKSYFQRVVVLFLVLFTNAYFEAHCIRFRHGVTNYFYPKRSRKRAIWLYNETLRRRKSKESFFKTCALENADKFRTHVSRNPLVWLADSFPNQCRCLKWWKLGRRKCVVCTENGEVFRCPQCNFSYCQECYQDLVINQGCLYCAAAEEIKDRRLELLSVYNKEDEIV
ncbi:DC-STAMP domain-containing protein 1 [Folsomia candida]|uniref:DC-STAMP domain-containing protein 1 n=1 Tax=Folsomia candida TaxID=158441 RepID=A0A226EZX9_FOLCA|nr:DC-STAMP domain-containing protein 1 [Folsomia candida]